MQVETTKLSQEEMVRLATEKQLILNPDAIPLLAEYSDYYSDFLNEFSKENVFSISKEMVEKKIGEKKSKLGKVLEVEVIDRKFVPIAKDTSSNYKILEDMNITTEKSAGGNKSIDFVKLFQEKFAFISECFKKRGFNPKNSFSALEKLPRNQEVELIGMVSEKWESKNGNLCLRVEDLESDIIVIVMKNNQQFYEKAKRILFDDVILIKGKKATEGMVIADQFHWPELPLRKSKTIDEDLSVLVSSDIHVGSRLFLEKEFSHFIEWMNGKGLSEKERQAVGKIKYMTIIGDCVDGIGVYPSQISELNVRDIFEQYKILEDYLLQIPEHVEVFIIPGNHDATRWADPQLPLDHKFLPRASKMSNIHLLSSPAWLEIEGLITTLYHGGGLFGVMGALNMNTMKPADAIQELLIRRDLMAMYGTKHPYVPEKTNYMLVREVPDLYFGGDNHHNDYGNYRGTTIINNGCWQDQTAYATQLGHIVTPCRVPIYNMKTAKIREVNFTQPNVNEREMGVQG